MTKKENKRKIRAVMAGGMVLGVGAMLTMAAWNSSEFASGTFKTGVFVMEGKTSQEAVFSKHPAEASAAQLSFSVDTSNLSPGDVVAAPFAVRLSNATTFDADVVLKTKVTDPVTGLSYRVYTSATEECTGAVVQSIASPKALATGLGNQGFSLARGATGVAGASVNLCFEVTADETLTQGGTSIAVWELAATQKTAP